jgi:hypothetical protein
VASDSIDLAAVSGGAIGGLVGFVVIAGLISGNWVSISAAFGKMGASISNWFGRFKARMTYQNMDGPTLSVKQRFDAFKERVKDCFKKREGKTSDVGAGDDVGPLRLDGYSDDPESPF